MNEQTQDTSMNPDELYREDVFTDQRIGSIRQLTPVTPTGEEDNSREVIYIGSTQVMSPMGAIPISFELDANSIGEAAEKFGPEAEAAVERTAREIEQLRREQASKIVVPGQGGGMGGGAPGGGIIT
ncbi:MAG: hypothetical protein R3E73_00070 [Porticoccaceae bacterium]|nr:hypothetical protein [Pseudomonadales bacterium]